MQSYKRINIEWRPIPGFEDQYEVSNYGDFHILSYDFVDKANRHIHREEYYKWSEELSEYGGEEKQGKYLGIHLSGMKHEYAHRLAALAFCPNPDHKLEVNHKDGNTHNNYCGCKENNYQDSNLEWVTSKENMEHASQNGLINHESWLRKLALMKNREKINYEAMKRPVYQLSLEGMIINRYESIIEAAKAHGIMQSAIVAVANKQKYHKTAAGYNWVYVDEYDSSKPYIVLIDQGSGNRKAIVQRTLSGEFVAEYQSIQEACKITGFKGDSYISECCKGKRKNYKNYMWEYKNK